ncbi:MAG: cyclic nucleotide-binding domain-containing protein [Gemmataceae bacterium]
MILPEEIDRIPFLRNLSEPHAISLARLARLKEFPEGTVLFTEGQDSPLVYFVLQGTVALEAQAGDHGSVEVYSAGTGDLVGWSPVLGRYKMTATARAVTHCRAAVLDAGQIRALWEKDPRFEAAFLREIALVLSDRLSSSRHYLAYVPTLGAPPPPPVGRDG